MAPIGKLLIANRGEIAVRIMKTAKARGMETVAVYSDADAGAFHTRCADEAVRIGGPAPADSYLNIAAIIEAAKRSGAGAIHPGYGFLSERADFAQASSEAGFIFVGPPAAAIAAMGDKSEAKRRMIEAGLACIPGYHGTDQSDGRLCAEAAKIGFPLMVKAAAGGGGRGMRLVREAAALSEALKSARTEAQSAFGDGRLLLEKFIDGARHVEIQIVADAHGNCIHLGERDCSLQRRRQKLIEEAPSPVLSPELRTRIGETAVRAACAVGYVNAGTVEFLFDPASGEFFFLEMNTRLQVEHPVTEFVTGLDLVALQLDIAEGKPLPLTQDEVRIDGWAIEARLYAEDPARNFLPQTGAISVLAFPKGVRVDSGVAAGDEVTAHYDPLIAKLIARGATRDEARHRLASALEETVLLGLTTNAPFLVSLLRSEIFARGDHDASTIEDGLDAFALTPPPSALEIALAAAAFIGRPPGALLTGWNSRGAASFPLKLRHGEEMLLAAVTVNGPRIKAVLGAVCAEIEVVSRTANEIRYRAAEQEAVAFVHRSGAALDLKAGPAPRRFIDATFAPAGEYAGSENVIRAPMAGVVTKILARPGDRVAKGAVLATMEAMKMEHRLVAPRAGIIGEICVAGGQQIAIRAPIIRLKDAG